MLEVILTNNRPDLFSNESLASYVIRLAKANYYNNVYCFSSEWQVRRETIYNNDFNEIMIRILSHESHHAFDKLYLRSNNFYENKWGTELFNKLTMKNKVKFCPKCIRKRHHHKTMWNFIPVNACLKHSMLLVDECQGCNKRISMVELLNGKCSKCKFLLKTTLTTSIKNHPDIYRFHQMIQQKLFGTNNHLTGYLENIDLTSFIKLSTFSFYLLQGLSSFVFDPNSKIDAFVNQKGRFSNYRSFVAYTNVCWMYEDFPSNFNKVLAKFELKAKKAKDYQKGMLNNFLMDPFFKKQKQLTKHLWTKKVEVHVKTTIELGNNNNNKIQRSRKKKLNCGVTHNYIIESDFKEQSQLMTRDQAAKVLGISSKVQMNLLIEAGFLKLKKYPSNRWYLDKSEVENFLDAYRGIKVNENVKGIKFYDVLKKYPQIGLSMSNLFYWMKDKKLISYTHSTSGKLSDILFKEDDIENCVQLLIKDRQLLKGYYAKEVRGILNLGQPTIKQLKTLNILVPDQILQDKNAKEKWLYDKNHIDSIKEQFISLVEARKKFNVSNEKIRKWLQEGKLTDLFQGLTKRYLVNIDDLVKLINKTTEIRG